MKKMEEKVRTIVRIKYDEEYQIIKEMEILKIIRENKTTYRLSNGTTVSKKSLFPYYHGKGKTYCKEEEYFFTENIKF